MSVHVRTLVERLAVADCVGNAIGRSGARVASVVGAGGPGDLFLLRNISWAVEFDPVVAPLVAASALEGRSVVESGAGLTFERQEEATAPASVDATALSNEGFLRVGKRLLAGGFSEGRGSASSRASCCGSSVYETSETIAVFDGVSRNGRS